MNQEERQASPQGSHPDWSSPTPEDLRFVEGLVEALAVYSQRSSAANGEGRAAARQALAVQLAEYIDYRAQVQAMHLLHQLGIKGSLPDPTGRKPERPAEASERDRRPGYESPE